MYAIETHNLSKAFYGMYAVNHLDMHVPQGAIYGFIGENGSGKSTTEKLICGLLVPKAGSEIYLFGRPHIDPKVRAKLGVLIENPGCFPAGTVYQNLKMQALNLGVPNPDREVKRVLKKVHMESVVGRKFGQCSLGMKQRIGVAQSLMGRPKMLILDEPINGLDADGMRIVRETLLDLNQREGVTILISSHILGELSKIATHYGVIRQGKLIRELRAEELQRTCRQYVLVRTANDVSAYSLLRSIFPSVEAMEEGVRINDTKDSAGVAALLFENGIAVQEISARQIGLEEYYLDVMQGGENHANSRERTA